MKYKSEIFEVIHQDAVEMYKVGGITEARMQEYDKLCLLTQKAKQETSPVYDNDTVDIEHISPATA